MNFTDEQKIKLRDLIDNLARKDNSARLSMLMEIKENQLFFAGFQRLIRNYDNTDWLAVDTLGSDELSRARLNPEDLGRVIGITKAHCEALIAAITAAIPSVRFFPENAEDPDDLLTSDTYSKAAEIIQHQNKIKIKFMYAVYTRLMQHFVAFYNYHDVDEKYGSYTVPKTGEKNYIKRETRCVNCGEMLGQEEGFEDEVTPRDTLLPEADCPNCNEASMMAEGITTPSPMLYPEISEPKEVEIGFDINPKSQEVIEVYGPKFVRIASYAKELSDSPYLILETEQHYALMRTLYPDYFDKIKPGSANLDYNRWSRAPIQFDPVDEREYLTHRRVWLQSWVWNAVDDEKFRLELQKDYPDGAKVTFVDTELVECIPENMLEHWTISVSPTSDTLHDAPLVRPIIELNKIINDMTTLTEETIRQGIPQGFADPSVLDFDAYRDSDVTPGNIYPAVPRVGKSLNDAFYEVKTASLSQEVAQFNNFLQQMCQFTMGSFPSVYGGPQEGDRTAAEYSQSRTQALQRLSIHWEVLSEAFAGLMSKSTSSFFKNIKYDERYTLRKGNSFFNVLIERAKASGKIGKVLHEVSDQLPTTWVQKRAMMFQMLGMNKEPVDMTAFHPNNMHLLKSVIGIQELFVPGEDDRNKQLSEIIELIAQQPIGPEQSSIPPELGIDDDAIHIQTCKAWAVSEEGQFIRRTNPAGYENVVFHMHQHEMNAQMEAMKNAGAGMGQPPAEPQPSQPSPQPLPDLMGT